MSFFEADCLPWLGLLRVCWVHVRSSGRADAIRLDVSTFPLPYPFGPLSPGLVAALLCQVARERLPLPNPCTVPARSATKWRCGPDVASRVEESSTVLD